MKALTMFLAGTTMAMAATALAGNGLYEIEVASQADQGMYDGRTIWQPEPLYPKLAMRRGLGGEVLVAYDVNENGKAENIRVLDASPKGFFNGATVRALENATFGVAYSDGAPATSHGVQKRFIYAIEYADGDKANYQVSVK